MIYGKDKINEIELKFKKKMRKSKKKLNPKINPNKIIDATFHPLFKDGKRYVIIDGILHFLVEQNPRVSTKKFLRYSLKHILK